MSLWTNWASPENKNNKKDEESMNKLRKMLLLIVAAMLLGLTACGSEPAVETPVETTPNETTEAPVVETVQEENIVVIEEPVEEAVVENVVEEPVEEIEEVAIDDEPVAIEKTGFAFDISKIDFSDDDEDDIPAPVSNYDDLTILEDNTEDNSFDDDSQAMSFKNFFKKN